MPTPIHQTLFNNIKFLKLCKILKSKYGRPNPYTLGYLSYLWWHVYSGRMEIIKSKEDIELMAEWDGTPGEFADILIAVGFIDILDDGKFTIHDYAGNFPDELKEDFIEMKF